MAQTKYVGKDSRQPLADSPLSDWSISHPLLALGEDVEGRIPAVLVHF